MIDLRLRVQTPVTVTPETINFRDLPSPFPPPPKK